MTSLTCPSPRVNSETAPRCQRLPFAGMTCKQLHSDAGLWCHICGDEFDRRMLAESNVEPDPSEWAAMMIGLAERGLAVAPPCEPPIEGRIAAAGDDRPDPRRSADAVMADWLDAQANFYRGLESDLGDFAAEFFDEQARRARGWRITTPGQLRDRIDYEEDEHERQIFERGQTACPACRTRDYP